MKNLKVMVFSSALSVALIGNVQAAPEDRGAHGWFVATGGGAVLGSASDEDGRDAGSYLGSGGLLRVGDEVIPGLTLAVGFSGGGGDGANEGFAAGFGGLSIEAGWRVLADDLPGLILTVGTGIGGGALTPTDDAKEAFEGQAGGAYYTAGAAWEFDLDGEVGGLSLGPLLRWYGAPAQMESKTALLSFVLGVEMVWYGGR